MSNLIKALGGPAVVARRLNIKPPSVISWKGRIPPDRRPELEREFYPKATVEAMGDDVLWQRVPDPAWPHPDGRPCMDIAGRPPAASPAS